MILKSDLRFLTSIYSYSAELSIKKCVFFQKFTYSVVYICPRGCKNEIGILQIPSTKQIRNVAEYCTAHIRSLSLASRLVTLPK